MMDLAAEKKRLQDCDAYGVKTTRQWNEWHREWERQHPRRAVARRWFGYLALTVATLFCWAPLWLPIVQFLKGI